MVSTASFPPWVDIINFVLREISAIDHFQNYTICLCSSYFPNLYLNFWSCCASRLINDKDLYLVVNFKHLNAGPLCSCALWDWCVMRGAGRPAVTILAQCDSRICSSSLSTICPFFKYINNQKRLINFPPDGTQQLLTCPKKKRKVYPLTPTTLFSPSICLSLSFLCSAPH